MTARMDLGVGISAAEGLDDLWPQISRFVDVVEVDPHRPFTPWLRTIDRPLLVHGAASPVGGHIEPDPRCMSRFAHSCQRLHAEHASEHLAFNRAVSNDVFFDADVTLPTRQTWDTVDAAVEHIRQYKQRIDVPFLVEGAVSYLRPAPDELDDGTFLSEIAQRADCGIVLDLHGMLANERNGRYPVEQMLRTLPLEHVLELHIGNGRALGDFWLHSHDGACDQTMLALLTTTLPLLPNVRAVIFEAGATSLSALGARALRRQLDVIQGVVEHASRRPLCRQPQRPRPHRSAVRPDVAESDWQRRLLSYATRRAADPPGDDPGFAVLRHIADLTGLADWSEVSSARSVAS